MKKISNISSSSKPFLRLVILGDSQVGKTQIVNKYLKKEFEENSFCTIGYKIDEKMINIDNKEIMVKIEDITGNEKFRDNLLTFCSKWAQGFIIVFSLESSDTFGAINHYINLLKENTNIKEKPIFVVKNKNDKLNENNDSKTFENSLLKEFSNIESFKYYECSAKTGENIDNIFSNMINILYNKNKEQFDNNYFIKEQAEEKEKKEVEIYKEKLLKYYNESNPNILRCFNCNQIPLINIDPLRNLIEYKCPNHCEMENKNKIQTRSFSEINDNKYYKNLSCFLCEKKENRNELLYTFKYKKFICKSCIKDYCKKEKIKIEEYRNFLIPYYLLDTICIKHNKIKNCFCKDCDANMCKDCIYDPKRHEVTHHTELIKEEEIKNLIKDKRKYLQKELDIYNKIDNLYNDLLEILSKLYLEFRNKNISENNIKKDLLNQLENILYNNELYRNVQNLTFFEKIDDYSKYLDSSWEKKLESMLLVIKNPVKIEPFDVKENKVHYEKINENIKDNETITDVINLSKSAIVLSYNNGMVKIYDNNNLYNKLNEAVVFDNKKGINCLFKIKDVNSVYKDKNIFLASGYESVKILAVDDLFKKIKINDEIKGAKIFYNNIIDFITPYNILYTTYSNEVIVYNILNKQKENIVNKLSIDDKKFILNLKKLNNNKYIFEYINIEDNKLMNNIKNNCMIINSKKEVNHIKKYYKIFNIDINKAVSNLFDLPENFEILGQLNENLLLLKKKNISKNYINLCIFSINNKNGSMVEGYIEDFLTFTFYKTNQNIFYFCLIKENLSIIQYCLDIFKNRVNPILFINSEEKVKIQINLYPVKVLENEEGILIIFDYGNIISIDK